MRKLAILLMLAVPIGCAHRARPFIPVPLSFSEVAPRYCLEDHPEWSADSYCRKQAGQWTCYRIRAKLKANCEQIEVHPE